MQKMFFVCFSKTGCTISGSPDVHDFESVLKNIYRNRKANLLDLSEPVFFTGARWHLTDQKPSLAMVASWDYFLTKWGWNK